MKKTILTLLLILPELALGHHGIANFDLNSDVGFTGVLTDVAFINPHSWIYVDVSNADGTAVQWKCELRAATVLRRSGWSKEMFKLGTEVTITGSPDRFDDNTCYMGSIDFADGSSMNRYGQLVEAESVSSGKSLPADRPLRLANGNPNISGDWAAEQRVMTDPRGISGAFLNLSVAQEMEPGEVPEGGFAFPGARGTPASMSDTPIETAWARSSSVALTAAGQEALEGFDGSSTDNPRLRCEATNILFDWTFDTDVNRIEQSESAIIMSYGFMGLVRTIHLDQRQFPTDLELSRSGYSLGHWDGDVLVVYTQGFLPGVLSADANTLHSNQLQVRERFTLDVKTSSLNREYIAEDALFFNGQYRGRDSVLLSQVPYETYNCDDRSYRSDL